MVGHPVSHSMSKVMHEAAFRELGLDHTYGLFDVTENELKLFMESRKFMGLNVTIPLKTAVVAYLDELSPDAALIGSVNTIEYGGKRIGHNTDVIGFMKSLEDAEVEVSGMTFLVLGAGGAGRGIVFKLAMSNARVYCYDKDSVKAAALANDVYRKVGVRVESVAEIADAIRKADVLVNATPVGMHPKVDESPVMAKLLHPALTVVDIVYNPPETRLLKQAADRGCKTVNGVSMLVYQGAEALSIWLDVKPPIEAMREAVLSNL